MRGRGQVTPIDVLPDEVLLTIFDFYIIGDGYQYLKKDIEAWQPLVHVCRRWRCVVFGSPRRLNLRLVCTTRTPTSLIRENLDVWPALPIVVEGIISPTSADDIVAALGHSNRICRIDLQIPGDLQWDEDLAVMQVPFPALTHLLLQCDDEPEPVIPDNFLGGSAPRLLCLKVEGISFPGIPNLLLAATHLVILSLTNIPHSGYISPEAMATCLSVTTSLEALFLEFISSRSRPDEESRRLPPMTRSILSNLNTMFFEGASEYLKDLVARIDAPQLNYLSITFFHQMNFDTPHLVQFISRTPTFQEPNEAFVSLDPSAEVHLLCGSDDRCVEFLCRDSDQQLLAMMRVCRRLCTMCLPLLPTVEILRLGDSTGKRSLDWRDNVENDQWLDLLRPFTAVKNLYLSKAFQPKLASALQELVGGRTTEVLPSLQNIFFEGSKRSGRFQEAIGQFVAARQLSGHPIAVRMGDN